MSARGERPSYVVVGAGAAGLVLALRLLDAGSNVTLVERGSEFADARDDTLSPLDWGHAAMGGDCEGTRPLTAPQGLMHGRQLTYPQGSGLGGSTNINACIWSAGHRGVFDTHWPAQWNSNQFSEYLGAVRGIVEPTRNTAAVGSVAESILQRAGQGRQLEEQQQISSEQGIWNSQSHNSAPLSTATVSAKRTTRLQDLIRGHGSTASGGKLLLHCEAEAEFIVFEGAIAVGVHVRLKNGSSLLLKPVGCGEIILCCGAFETPRLLIASGLKGESLRSAACAQYQLQVNSEVRKREREKGSSSRRESDGGRARGTTTASDSRPRGEGAVTLVGIGMNMQDHAVVPVICVGNWWRRSQPTSVGAATAAASTTTPAGESSRGLVQTLFSFVSLLLFRAPGAANNSASYPPNAVHGWIDLDENGNVFSPSPAHPMPSAQLVFIDGRMSPGMIAEMMLPRFGGKTSLYGKYLRPILFAVMQLMLRLSLVKWLCSFCFGFLVCLTRPHSRGRLADPTPALDPLTGAVVPESGPLLADPAFLADERDRATLRAAVATAHNILEESRQQDGLWYLELMPGLPFSYCRAADFFDLYASLFVAPMYHACGTCRMGDLPSSGSEPPVVTTACAVGSSGSSGGSLGATDQEARAGSGDETDPSPRTAMVSASASGGGGGKRTRGETTVVDPELRVRGIAGLRIADASVFPAIPSGPIMAVCMGVGEACARLLLRDQEAANNTAVAF